MALNLNTKHVLQPIKVVIIGAGTSGLAAAEVLGRYQCFQVIVLEASCRPGGRICTQRISDDNRSFIELGATFVHGATHDNVIYELALANNIKLGKIDHGAHDRHYGCESGLVIDQAILSEVSQLYYKSIHECNQIYQAGQPHESAIDNSQSVGAYLRDKLNQRLKEVRTDEYKTLFASIFRCYEIMECSISSCNTLYDLQLKEFGEYKEVDGPNLIFKDGYDSVIQTMVDKLSTTSVKVKFDSRVKTIDYTNVDQTSDTAESNSKSTGNSPILVVCTNGARYYADHLICTVSLGVLKESASTLFKPILPQPKLRAIQKLGFDVVNKVFLYYDKPFWNGDNLDLAFVWNDDEYKNRDVQSLNLNHEEEWLRSVCFVYSCEHCRNMLMFWVAGKAAQKVESLTDAEIGQSLTKVLKFFVQDYKINLPDEVFRSSWYSNPNVRGSYTYLKTGTNAQDFDIMAQPVVGQDSERPLIMFAGEATHRKFYSTVHGAYLSGRREATRLLNVYGLEFS